MRSVTYPVGKVQQTAAIRPVALLYGLVKVSTGVLKVEKRSGAERQTAKLKINANDRVALAA